MKIGHAAIYYNDLEKAKDFFIRYFGAVPGEPYHNKKTDFRSYFLSFDGDARLEIMNRPDAVKTEPQLARTGYIHMAFEVGSKEKVDEMTEQLKADGYQIISGPRTTGDGYYESCFLDFEGNQIEITV